MNVLNTHKFSARYISLGILVAVVLASVPFPIKTAQATGVTPPTIYIDDVVSNVPIRRTFTVTRISAAADEIITLSTREESGKLIRFPEGDTFVFPAGELTKTVSFTVLAENIPTGKYIAHIRAKQAQPPKGFFDKKRSRKNLSERVQEAAGAGSMNLSGAEVDVHLSITNKKIEKWEARNADLSIAEEDTPIDFNIEFDNQGGTRARPDKVRFVVNGAGPKNKSFHYDEEIAGNRLDYVDPYTKRPLSIFTGARLSIGKYFADVYVYDKGNVLKYSAEKIPLEIVKQGTLGQDAKFVSLKLDRPEDQIPALYEPNSLGVIRGVIRNTGQSGFRTKLMVSILKGGKKIDSLTSNEGFVPQGQAGEFEVDYKYLEEGEYTVTAYFPYGIKKTEEKSLSVLVRVPAPEKENGDVDQSAPVRELLTKASLGNFSWIPLIGALIVILLLAWFMLRKKALAPIGALCLWEHAYTPKPCPWWCPLPRDKNEFPDNPAWQKSELTQPAQLNGTSAATAPSSTSQQDIK